jgi:hypothetical protein|tara:strand:- start:279 stop:602 length:324 start_codon:yes stop_codon:yes gene_type:complete
MAGLSTKIELYAKAKGISKVDFLKDVRLRDDGKGAFIEEWNLTISKPTDEQIASYETAGNTEESNNKIRMTRKLAYGDIGEQLDEIYKDIDAWKARIKKIKDDNPKG